MIRNEKVLYVYLMISFFLLISCKPTVPSNYIQPGDMEKILYDYHLAMSLATQKGNSSQIQKTYKLMALKKHGVSESQFELSMRYYMRHTEKLHKIYENLSLRFEEEARIQGISENDLNQYGSLMLQGDTADIWNKAKSMVLTPYVPRNYEYFTIKADTSFHKGDKLMLNFDSKFIIQDGTRNAIVVLNVVFKNDSISSQTLHINSDSHQSLVLEDNDGLGIKSVYGYFLMAKPQELSSTFKLLILTNIRLIKMHVRGSEGNQPDSMKATGDIRMVGDNPVNPHLPLKPYDEELKEQRTPQEAMRERNIPERVPR